MNNRKTTAPSRLDPWVSALLRWFDRHREPMPWRSAPTPYRVWISEIMLQQTRVPTAIPYFDRFVRRFPNVRALAKADLQDVLKLWEGLGYYARARNAHRTARLLCEQQAGQLPAAAAELQRLPGIGPYTAAAIASIAFGQPVPLWDGNVRRVLARLRARNDTADRTLAFLQRRLPPNRPGDFNQALMELGRLVCQPRRPRCETCPLRKHCRARARNATARFPARAKHARIPWYDVVACVIRRNGRYLIARRPADSMLGGLWEFPGGKREPGETLAQTAIREMREELGIEIEPLEPVATVRHAFSHFGILLHALRCRLVAGRPLLREHEAVRWVRPAQFADFPLPAADRRIARMLSQA